MARSWHTAWRERQNGSTSSYSGAGSTDMAFQKSADRVYIDRGSQLTVPGLHEYKLMLESISEGVFVVDRCGLITFVNRPAAEILGWCADELVGREHQSVVHHTRADGRPYAAAESPTDMPWDHNPPPKSAVVPYSNGDLQVWLDDRQRRQVINSSTPPDASYLNRSGRPVKKPLRTRPCPAP